MKKIARRSKLALSSFLFFWLGFIAVSLFFACQPVQQQQESEPDTKPDPYEHIADLKARELLKKAIERAGGLDEWNNIQELKFEKYFALYTAEGDTENEAWQNHLYQYQPEEAINISWTSEDGRHEINQQAGDLVKKVDGRPDTQADRQSLLNSVLSATFVIGIPFKLLDKGAELSYAGLDTLEGGQIVEVLKVVYNPQKHDNLTTADIWMHYYDRDDYKQVGYMVQHADHFSYVENLSHLATDGFLFPGKRESYRVDSLGNKLYLRAKYEYKDYNLLLADSENAQ